MGAGVEWSFRFPVPKNCIDLGCISYCNWTVPVPEVLFDAPDFIWTLCWIGVFALTLLLLALILIACCIEGDPPPPPEPEPLPPSPPPHYRISMFIEAWQPDGQRDTRKVTLTPFVSTRTARRNNLKHYFQDFLDPDVEDEDYEVLLQKNDRDPANLSLDDSLIDQDAEENDTIIFKHKELEN